MKKRKQNKKYPVQLSNDDVAQLKQFVTTGTHHAQEITRARILLLSHEGQSDRQIMDKLACSNWLVPAMRIRLHERGSWQAAIKDAPRPGQPPKLTEIHKAHVVAMACTPAPAGHTHWTATTLKADLLKTYKEIRSLSDEPIRQLLVAREIQPWREKNVVHPQTHS